MTCVLRLWLALLLVCSVSGARAQADAAEVVVSEDTVSAAVFEVLHAALSRHEIGLRRSVEPSDCRGALEAALGLRARVWLQWKKHLVSLCFQDRCGSSERVLGPFAELDARAREEVITVIESGLDALRYRCASAPATTADAAKRTSATEAMDASRSVAPAQGAPPHRAATPEPASRVPAPEVEGVSTLSQLPDVVRQLQEERTPTQRALLLLAARYGLTRWSNRVIGQYVGGAVAYSVQPLPVFVGMEVDYAPPFRALQDELVIAASCLRIALQLWARWPLSRSTEFDVQLGPALDWLSLAPSVRSERVLQDPRTAEHLDPHLFVRIGPAFRVYNAFFLGIELQLDAAFLARSYGFVVGQAQREVFAPDPVRLSLAVHARAEL